MENRRMALNLLYLFTCIIVPLNLVAQNQIFQSDSAVEELFKIAERYYPLNDEYINGFVYPVRGSKIAGDPYFNSSNWLDGTLYINETEYKHIPLKYNLINDELILKTKTRQDIVRLIVLNKAQVDSFKIEALVFIHSKNLFRQEDNQEFYQEICGKHPNLKILKRYGKRFIDTYSNSTPYGKYSAQKNDTYLFDGKKLILVNSEKAFLGCFEKSAREPIKDYIRKRSIQYKNISVSQFNELVNYCVELIAKNNETSQELKSMQ